MISYNDVLDQLQDYMLHNENIQKSIKTKISSIKSETPKVRDSQQEKSSTKKPALYIPNQQDTLFWCFYIIKYGDIKYETMNNKNSLVAKQIKIDFVESIRKNKDIVKMHKFDTITNLESNLANDNNLNPKTFLTLCAIENINIIYVSKKTYYELFVNDSNIVYIVHELPSQSKYYNKYGFEMACVDSLNHIKTTYYQISNVDKPIKSASAYKVQDLINICSKLGIETTNKDTGKNKTKNDLYEAIVQYF
jgi:hypothetical protein